MKRVVTFGEIMLRLAPRGYERFLQSPSFEATFGGAEANVAVSLANFGMSSSFVTKIPENPIGRAALDELKKFGVGVEFAAFGGERLGIYYMEKGAGPRPSLCVYDRKNSAISQAAPGDFDWSAIFRGAAAFHFTGITPALSKNCAALCLEAVKAAKKAGVLVFCDLNFRQKLWTKAQAKKTMTELCRYVDVCVLNESDAADVFGIKAARSNIKEGKLCAEGYQEVAAALFKNFPFKAVAISQRESYSASFNGWSGLYFERAAQGKKASAGKKGLAGQKSAGGLSSLKMFASKKYELPIVDRVGGGDAFAAGIIYGALNKLGGQRTIDFAAASGALQQMIEGDFNRVSVAEVERLAGGDSSGRVLR
ncbi:MAG: sugar kinase [Treponema sp.]|nr:sugar kinase [Treponema sp.]